MSVRSIEAVVGATHDRRNQLAGPPRQRVVRCRRRGHVQVHARAEGREVVAVELDDARDGP